MESELCDPSKPRYDITMSKRTRKPPTLLGAKYIKEEDFLAKRDSDHKSLKQLINGNINIEEIKGNVSRSSPEQHFLEEEKQLQLVTRKHKKLKGMMGHYVRVLTQLINLKRDSDPSNSGSQKKPILRLAM
ncbi:conserved hypothetical protein [Ricinus communis]|uniref:Uncharacterized protein n=1 Tax=Ricinus communis TaxID=3988 RepID=B9REP2_RICCO|nr:conserved hypothetical protein [Ricinus communis]|eukprot:XP_002512211.1 uncharacterized protein LOC8289336 [Ricinus communis]